MNLKPPPKKVLKYHFRLQKLKALKAENVARYRKQLDETGEIEYNGHVDEIQLHKNQMALVGGMFNSGMITKEDLEDEI